MAWTDLMADVAETITSTFGQPAIADWMPCRVMLDVIPKSLGTFEQMAEDHPVMIFLRSEIPDGLDAGAQVDITGGDSYLIEGPADERSDLHHVAYWVQKVLE